MTNSPQKEISFKGPSKKYVHLEGDWVLKFWTKSAQGGEGSAENWGALIDKYENWRT